MLAAQSASKGKGKKKKWAKSKLREKKDHRVVFNQSLFDGAMNGAAKKSKYITIFSLIEAYKIGGSLARKLVRELLKAGSIKPVALGANMSVYAPKVCSFIHSFTYTLSFSFTLLLRSSIVHLEMTHVGMF